MRQLPDRKTTRLHGWDYRQSAAYFVTICASKRKHYFGEIANGIMHLSEIGGIARIEWMRSMEIRPDMNLEMGALVVMPDHIHGIISIGRNEYNRYGGNDRKDAMHCVPTSTSNKNRFGPQRKNLSSIIRGYKSAVTKRAHQIDPGFAWQPRFYDHIIRNPDSSDRIEQYIQANPENWPES